MQSKHIVGGLIVVALLAGCSSTGVANTPDAPGSTSDPTAKSTSTPVVTREPTEEPEPTPEPTPVSKTFRPGDPIEVTQNDEPWATILIDKVKQVTKYEGEYADDTPEIKGNAFIELRVTYEAMTDGVNYNPFDWQVFAGGAAVDGYAFVINGPEPGLSSGTLPMGRTAQGWLVYEIPPKGEVLLSYGGSFSNEAPVFEVVLRDG